MELSKTQDVLNAFVDHRPEALGAYGYGSGVFKQVGYDGKVTPQIDIVFLVENLKEWHMENLRRNNGDYSFLGRLHINTDNISKLKGYNGITYYSNIYENGFRFKYGVMEDKDFIENLNSWQNFFIAGRFHKPVLEIKGTVFERKAIIENRKQALLVAALLSSPMTSTAAFYETLCTMSYYGSLRMGIAENPNKVHNIVHGSYDRLRDIYNLECDYIKYIDSDSIVIDHGRAMNHLRKLPTALLDYLHDNGYIISSLSDVRFGIVEFLKTHNRVEEFHQSIDGIKTNGVVRSVPYLLAKVKKRITR